MDTVSVYGSLWLLLAGVLLTLVIVSLVLLWKSRDGLTPWLLLGLFLASCGLVCGRLELVALAGGAQLVYTSKWLYFDVRKRRLHLCAWGLAGLVAVLALVALAVSAWLAIAGGLVLGGFGLALTRFRGASDSGSGRGLSWGWTCWLAGMLCWAGAIFVAASALSMLAAFAFTLGALCFFGSLFERGALKQQLQSTVAQLEDANTTGFAREAELRQSNAALTLSQRQLEDARRTLEQKNREAQQALAESARIGDALLHVSESIAYARRIQEGLLTGRAEVRAALPESIFYNRPRDVVSGDFCWLSHTDDALLIAVADCTGHGVPGAFMTVLASSLLQRVVDHGEHEPHQILEAVDQLLRLALAREAGRSVEDGMDIGLCRIDRRGLTFAGARHALVQVREGQATVHESERRSIGGNLRRGKKQPFHTRKVSVKRGDRFYLFSDGFMDQLGGSEGRKYMRQRFYDILPWLAGLTFAEQERALDQIYEKWRGSYAPTDDRLILGFELPATR